MASKNFCTQSQRPFTPLQKRFIGFLFVFGATVGVEKGTIQGTIRA
jgi:hypothetical protein